MLVEGEPERGHLCWMTQIRFKICLFSHENGNMGYEKGGTDVSIFWTPGAGPKPWWVPPPIPIDDMKLKSEIKLGENWDREEQLKSASIADRQTALAKENPEAIEHDEKLTRLDRALIMRDSEAVDRELRLESEIQHWNADFIRDLPEEQQWAFVNTMHSMQNSVIHLSNTAWMEDDSICGAVYGQNQAKIQMTSSLLGGKYADKMQEALDWFFDNTVGEMRKDSIVVRPLDKNNPKFIKFEELFKQLGSNTNAVKFKQQLKTTLDELGNSADKDFAIRPRPGGGTWANFAGFMVTDWNNYFRALGSAGFKNFAAFQHEIDVTA